MVIVIKQQSIWITWNHKLWEHFRQSFIEAIINQIFWEVMVGAPSSPDPWVQSCSIDINTKWSFSFRGVLLWHCTDMIFKIIQDDERRQSGLPELCAGRREGCVSRLLSAQLLQKGCSSTNKFVENKKNIKSLEIRNFSLKLTCQCRWRTVASILQAPSLGNKWNRWS